MNTVKLTREPKYGVVEVMRVKCTQSTKQVIKRKLPYAYEVKAWAARNGWDCRK